MSTQEALALVRSRSVDRKFLDQRLLDVVARARTNALPWRGQFTPGLPEVLIRSLSPTGIVLDPFAGSGTTLGEALRAGLPSLGTEVNPAAISLARVYELAAHVVEERRGALYRAERALETATLDAGGGLLGEGVPLHEALVAIHDVAEDGPARVLVAAALTLAMGNSDHATSTRLSKAWGQIRSLVTDLPETAIPTEIVGADARCLPVGNASVGMVLTSPPYINVFNYHQNYRPAMELLGWDILPAARSEIGSNRKHRGNRFLTVIQYCLDMAQALDEVMRVAEPGAPVVFVVGRESRVRGLAFPNGDILATLVETTPGLSFERWQERSFTSRFGGRIFEEILTFRRSSAVDGVEIPLDFARALGRALLIEARSQKPEGEAAEQLEGAISSADSVAPSPSLTLERLPARV